MTFFNDTTSVQLGALGWSHPAWHEAFYPADMPEEWQLTYYNTQFHCVYLEQSLWQQASSDQMKQWYADTHERFRFLLESDGTRSLPAELEGKAMLMPRTDARIHWFMRSTSLKQLATALADIQTAPCYVISLDGDLGQLERVATLLDVMGLAG